ncbi:MAG: cytochrome c biogenesis protein CcsA, partial [Actinobacteria bacterium]|nr:cytochrome c biogenesis protein CcsA [Actinomycetota bacterium]
FYACASGLYIFQSVKHTDAYRSLAHVFLIAGLVAHSITIGAISVIHGETILGGANILMLSSWALVCVYGIFEIWSKSQSYGAFILPLALIVMLVSWMIGLFAVDSIYALVYASWSYLILHVGSFIVSAACFFISGIASIMLLYQSHLLKTHKSGLMMSKLPSMSSLKKVTRRAVLIGLPIFTLGLVLGIIHSFTMGTLVTVSAAGTITYFSPRIIFSLCIWVLYVVYLVAVYGFKLSSRVLSWISVVGAIGCFVLMFMSSLLPMLNG